MSSTAKRACGLHYPTLWAQEKRLLGTRDGLGLMSSGRRDISALRRDLWSYLGNLLHFSPCASPWGPGFGVALSSGAVIYGVSSPPPNGVHGAEILTA